MLSYYKQIYFIYNNMKDKFKIILNDLNFQINMK
jgi:hypothetical protein